MNGWVWNNGKAKSGERTQKTKNVRNESNEVNESTMGRSDAKTSRGQTTTTTAEKGVLDIILDSIGERKAFPKIFNSTRVI